MQPQKPHAANLRKGRVSLSVQIYAVTVVTRKRQPFFRHFQTSRALVQVLREHDERDYAATLCFVVMPDHLHWLMQLGMKRDLSAVVRSVKSQASTRAGLRLWQKGFYDHPEFVSVHLHRICKAL